MGQRVIEALGIETSATHMEWFYGPKGLKFSEIGCPPAGRRRVGPLLRRPTTSTSTASGRTSSRTARPTQPMRRALRRRHRRAAPRPRRPDRRATAASTRSSERYGEWVIDAHFPPDGHRTQPVEAGYMANAWVRMRHPDYDTLRAMLDDVGEHRPRLRRLTSSVHHRPARTAALHDHGRLHAAHPRARGPGGHGHRRLGGARGRGRRARHGPGRPQPQPPPLPPHVRRPRQGRALRRRRARLPRPARTSCAAFYRLRLQSAIDGGVRRAAPDLSARHRRGCARGRDRGGARPRRLVLGGSSNDLYREIDAQAPAAESERRSRGTAASSPRCSASAPRWSHRPAATWARCCGRCGCSPLPMPDELPVVAWSAGAMALTRRSSCSTTTRRRGRTRPRCSTAGSAGCPGVIALPHARRRLRLDDRGALVRARAALRATTGSCSSTTGPQRSS